jgi:transketolase
MVGVAAGLAACGKIPFAYTISTFITMRAFEQIRNDVCLQETNVKLVGIGAGFVYSNLGPTHQATEDIAIMRSLPNMTIIAPVDPLESRKATFAAAALQGPVYLRLSVGGTPQVYKDDFDFKIGRAVTLKEGHDVTIIACGGIVHEALKAAEELDKTGISVRLINMHTIKPIDEQAILQAAADTGAVLTVEEHTINGGLGSAVAEVLMDGHSRSIQFKRLGLQDTFAVGYGSYDEMKQMNGLSKDDIAREAELLYQNKKTARITVARK